jgi:hypothetical protein
MVHIQSSRELCEKNCSKSGSHYDDDDAKQNDVDKLFKYTTSYWICISISVDIDNLIGA